MNGLAQADATQFPFVTDPNEKAGQDPSGGVSDALTVRQAKGPALDYYGSIASPTQLGATASGDAIYGDTLDVTDATYLTVLVVLFLNETGGAFSENVQIGVGLEASHDGVTWFPVPFVDRANTFDPTTIFRPDNGQSSAASTTGGYATAATTTDAPLPEDFVVFPPAPLSATSVDLVVQRVVPFNVAPYLYVRLVFVAIYDEPPDVTPPSLAVIVHKAS